MISSIDSCTGCSACKQKCPQKCISMIENSEGFLYPNIDKSKCIHCNLCEKVCPINKYIISGDRLEKTIAYAAINKDEVTLKDSSSGGMFSVIAEKVLDQHGIVFGCVFNDKLEAEHIYINSKKDLHKLRGSKYVQSNVRDTFRDTESFLKQGIVVLYTGTPCQIAGLKSMLNKEYTNLYTIDLICHGTPSQKIFNKYIEYLEYKDRYKISTYRFRYKDVTEKRQLELHTCRYLSKKYKLLKYPNFNSYLYAFRNAYIYRESCYKCKYTNLDRPGDFTIGDYWGIENYHKDFNNHNGVSSLILNTNKSKILFEEISTNLRFVNSKPEYIQSGNGNLKHPSIRPDIRDIIYTELDDKGFKYIAIKYFRPKKYYITAIKAVIPNSFKKSIKKILSNIIQVIKKLSLINNLKIISKEQHEN